MARSPRGVPTTDSVVGAGVPGGRVVEHAEVQSVHPVPQVDGQDELPAEVVAEEPHVGVGEVNPWNHEDNADGGEDGAEQQALERVAERGRAPPQERVDRDSEHDREDNPVDVVEDSTGQELDVRRRLRRVDHAVDAVPVQLRQSNAGHEVTDHGGQVRRDEARQQCGTYSVVAHPCPVPIDYLLTCRVASSLLTYRRVTVLVTVLARGDHGATRHDHPPSRWGCAPTAVIGPTQAARPIGHHCWKKYILPSCGCPARAEFFSAWVFGGTATAMVGAPLQSAFAVAVSLCCGRRS